MQCDSTLRYGCRSQSDLNGHGGHTGFFMKWEGILTPFTNHKFCNIQLLGSLHGRTLDGRL